MKATDILDKAAGHMRDRANTYDKPEGERSMAQTVAVFNLHHGTSLTETQGWHFLQILKDVRYFSCPIHHKDSAEDAVAYAALKAEAGAVERVGQTICVESEDSQQRQREIARRQREALLNTKVV